MTDTLRFTILGCGSSGGVPRIGGPGGKGDWGACDPSEPKNRRKRCALLVERIGASGTTRVLVDAGPDLRAQLIEAGVGTLDAVVFTHEHADHVHGIDDLRVVVFNIKGRLPVWADRKTLDHLTSRFGYVFIQPPGSDYPPILEMRRIDEEAFEVQGAGGPIPFQPFEVEHGRIDALGFRIGDLAYLPDVSDIPEAATAHLRDLDTWILDALRITKHPSHFNLDDALGWIDQMAPQRAVLTNLHTDLDYAWLCENTQDHITAAFDGMVIERPLV